MFERSEFFSSPKNEYCRWSPEERSGGGLQQYEPNRCGRGAGRTNGSGINTKASTGSARTGWVPCVRDQANHMIRLNHNTDSAAAVMANAAASKASKPEISVSFFSTVSRELKVS